MIGRVECDLLTRLGEILTAREAGVDGTMPGAAGPGRWQRDPLRFEVAVEDEEEPIGVIVVGIIVHAALARIQLPADRPLAGVLPPGRVQIRCKPGQVRHAVGVEVVAQVEPPALQDRKAPGQRNRLPKELDEILAGRGRGPVEPADLVVLAVGVVVAALRARELVAAQNHRRPRREQQIAGVVLHQLRPQRQHGGVAGVPFRAAVPRVVVVGSVLIVLAVGLVVLFVVRDQIVQGETVVAGDEVDAVVGRAAVVAVEIGRSGQTPADVGQLARISLAEAAHRVPEPSVPLRPVHREIAHLIRADVPRLRDHDDAVQHRILRDGVEERGGRLERADLAAAAEDRGQVETETVHVHDLGPVAQRVHDQPDDGGAVEVEAVAAARVVHVVALRRVGRPGQTVVGQVVQALEAQARPHLVPFARVVVDDIEDHLDARLVQLANQGLELGHLAARRPAGRIGRLGCEEPDRVVAPVVGQALLVQEIVDVALVHRQELDGVDAEPDEMGNLLDESEIRPGQLDARGRVRGKTLQVHFVDHQLLEPEVG